MGWNFSRIRQVTRNVVVPTYITGDRLDRDRNIIVALNNVIIEHIQVLSLLLSGSILEFERLIVYIALLFVGQNCCKPPQFGQPKHRGKGEEDI